MSPIPDRQAERERAARLQEFIDARFEGNRSAFARAAGTTPQRVKVYLEDVSPGAEILAGFLDAGLNVIWYLTGKEEMDYVVPPKKAGERTVVQNRKRLVSEVKKQGKNLIALLEELEKVV